MQKYIEQIAQEKARLIDQAIQASAPKWKLKIMKTFPYPIVAKLISCNFEIIEEPNKLKTKLLYNGKIVMIIEIEIGIPKSKISSKLHA